MQHHAADIMLTSRPCSPAGEAGTTADALDAISESLGRISELVLADEYPTARLVDRSPVQTTGTPGELACTIDEESPLDRSIQGLERHCEQTELPERIVRALTSAVDAKDPYMRGHSDRVACVAVRLAEELGCGAEMRKTVYLAGLLHDVGKIAIDDKVLRKTGQLSEGEYEHIKQHAEIGHRILHELLKQDEVLQVVLHHHEWWDGSGYPQQLDGERIPAGALIVAVADAFDAMSNDRPYRKRMSDQEVDQVLRDGAGRQWDPQVIDAFFRCRDEIRAGIRG
jgi:putative nucleotidyltransferase with HDIG domain